MNLESCDPLSCFGITTVSGPGCEPPIPNTSKRRSKKHKGVHQTTGVNENQIICSSHVSISGPMTYSPSYNTFPVVSSEEVCGWTKLGSGVLPKREKNRLKRREERANPAYREKERAKARLRMQEKRKDPLYRELERLKNRIRMRTIRSSKGDNPGTNERIRKHICKANTDHLNKEDKTNVSGQYDSQGYQVKDINGFLKMSLVKT